MALITAADKTLYFPSVSLTGAALDMAIASVQGLVEATIKRPLERRQYSETKRLSESFDACQLLYTPIVLSPAPIVEGRFGGGLSRTYRKMKRGEWKPIRRAEYLCDRSGRIEIKGGLSYPITEIRVRYFSGVDPLVDTPELRRLKAALGAALDYSQSDLFSGIASRSVDKEYSVNYGNTGAGSGILPEAFLSPFARYKPGSYQPLIDSDSEPTDTGAAHIITVPFSFGDASPKAIALLPINSTVFTATIVIQVPFNGVGSMLRLGDAGTPDRLITAIQNDPFEIAEYETNPGHSYTTETQVNLSITPGSGCTQGSGFVLIEV